MPFPAHVAPRKRFTAHSAPPGFTFTLDEAALRSALEDEIWIKPFAPMSVDADELHHLVRQCESRKIINPPNDHAGLAVYPLSIDEPAPVLAVDPGLGGPLLLGESVGFAMGLVPDPVAGSIAVISALVDEANELLSRAARAYDGLFARPRLGEAG